MDDTSLPCLPVPPPLGASALPPGTYDGSLVLVTGGGTGLGKAIAAEFARLGADLVIVSRGEEHLRSAQREYARFITGHPLVMDGANWQRRGLVSPPVVPVRDQLGRGPCTG